MCQMKLYSKAKFLQCAETEISTHTTNRNFLGHNKKHSSITLFMACVYKSLMNIITKFYLPIIFKSRVLDTSLHILKCVLQVTKLLKRDNIQNCLYA